MILELASRTIRGLDRLSVLARTCLASGGRRGHAVFLMFHSVGGLAEADYIVRWGVPSIPVDQLRQVLAFFARRGFHTLTVSDYARQRRQGDVAPGALVLTFDDGFRDNYLSARPVLREFGMTATFYPVCGWVGRPSPAWLHRAAYHVDREPERFTAGVRALAGERWAEFFRFFRPTGDASRDALLVFRQALHPSQQRDLLHRMAARHGGPPAVRLYMDWRELAELQQAGMEIGAHTVTHRSLWTLPLAVAAREIMHSRQTIERRLGSPVTSFAYPYGHHLPAHVSLLSDAGFLAAATTRGHNNDAGTPLLELGRHGINSGTLSRYALGCMALDATEDPVARVNRRLGRHLGYSMTDPEAGLVTTTAHGTAYDPLPGPRLVETGDDKGLIRVGDGLAPPQTIRMTATARRQTP